MEHLTDLKAILHSKRANIFYLEKCRVMQKDGRVLYLTEAKDQNYYWNIPIANTTVILLGTGTSITQAAMRMLASAGVLAGFCGGAERRDRPASMGAVGQLTRRVLVHGRQRREWTPYAVPGVGRIA